MSHQNLWGWSEWSQPAKIMKEFIVKQEKYEELLYTAKGYESFVDDNNCPRLESDGENVYAKAVRDKLTKSFSSGDTRNYSYYIKTDPSKNIYDPTIKHTIEPNMKKNFINAVCKDSLKFTQVSQNVFNKYLEFLKTGSKKYLIEAQRDIK